MEYTRNMLVGSSYPLEPEVFELRQQFMPFRDVYQASTFAACRAAVQAGTQMPNLTGDVYEIGRHGPVKLMKKPDKAPERKDGPAFTVATKLLLSISTYAALLAAVGLISAFFTLVLRHAPALKKPAGPNVPTKTSTQTEQERLALAGATANPESVAKPGQVTSVEHVQTHSGTTPVSLKQAKRPVRFLPEDGPYGQSAPAEPDTDGTSEELNRRWPAVCRTCGPALVATAVTAVFLLGGAISQWIAQRGSEEPWSFTEGVSIWPTEAIRVIAIILAARFLVSAWLGERRYRVMFWRKFFQPTPGAQLKLCPEADQGTQSSGTRPIRGSRLWGWVAKMYRQVALGPWHQSVQAAYARGTLSATELFRGYAELGRFGKRGLRLLVNVLILVLGLVLVLMLLGDTPTRSCVRGKLSRTVDLAVLITAVLGFFAVLFYAIDATRLASRLLTYLERPTLWPDWRKEEIARQSCLCKDDTDPLLDMQFAVEHTQHVRRFMLCPFILLLLLLISRLSFFEAWTWPLPLTGVFVLNFILAAACWAVLRRSAYQVRHFAVSVLTERAIQCEHAALLKHRGAQQLGATARWVQAGTGDYSADKYAERLRQVIELIKNERRGAFAPWIQDPTYLFLFIPTGITGMLTVGLHFLLN